MTAQKIIKYRKTNGPFTRVEDIKKVPGIGPETLERIKDLTYVVEEPSFIHFFEGETRE